MAPDPQQQQSGARDQSFVTSAYSVYSAEVRKAIQNQKQQISQLEAANEQLQQTLDSLQQLPAKLRHEVMVPLGKHAFFPGYLTRTNEFFVHLGDQYYAEVTAVQARGILQRRQAAVAEGMSKADQQLKALQARFDVSSDSLGSLEPEPEAREIRSSLAESDALLASVSKSKRQRAGQQAAQQPQRVTSASGYSYTRPQGAVEAQRAAQDDAEAAALQARLQELMLLEEQQQGSTDSSPAAQQLEHLQPGLATIAEGEEEEDVKPRVPVAAAGAAGGRHVQQPSPLERLQQLEAASDSDDEELPAALLPQLLEHQQQHQLLQDAQPESEETKPSTLPQLQQQQPVPRQPLKSALKKGFFGAAATPVSKASTTSSSAGSSSSSGGRSSSSNSPHGTAKRAPASAAKPAAFTGTIVERPTAALAPGVHLSGSQVGSQAADSGAGPGGGKPMSKFKMRRMGLEQSE